jgi:hypothetical protein
MLPASSGTHTTHTHTNIYTMSPFRYFNDNRGAADRYRIADEEWEQEEQEEKE